MENEKENGKKYLSEKEILEIRQIALIQAIADNKATKSPSVGKGVFVLGLVALILNTLAAVFALFLGCLCDTDKPVWYWVLFGIYIAAIAVSFALSLSKTILSRKNKKQTEDIDEQAKSGNFSLDRVLQMYIDDTEKVKEQKSKMRRLYFVSICITAVTTILAIITPFIVRMI